MPDRLDLDRAVARMDRNSVVGVAEDLARSRHGHQAALGQDILDRTTRTDPSNAPAAVSSRAAKRSRVPHIVKPVGTSRVARHLLWEGSAVPYDRAERHQAAAELLRYCKTPLARGR